MGSRIRNVCFTINNPTEDDRARLGSIDCTYIVYGEETGENGTAHIQGYVEFSSGRSWAKISKLLPRAHLEKRKGTAEQASEYCKKDGKWTARGEISKQGERNDIEEVRELCKGEMPMRKVTETSSYMGIKVAEHYLKYHEKQRCWHTKVEVIMEGTEGALPEGAYWKDKGKWWDGYDGHDVVIIRGINITAENWEWIEELTSNRPLRVEYKGGTRQFLANRIIILCKGYVKDQYHEYGIGFWKTVMK